MKALVFDGNELKIDNNYPEPRMAADEVLIKVSHAGVCSTDLEIIKGYMGFQGVPGHEFIGEVVDGDTSLAGKRVTAEINCVCGNCEMCDKGLGTHCYNRQTIGIFQHQGSFAEYIAVPKENVHIIPGSIDNDAAMFIEPLAAAFEIFHQIEITGSEKVAVIGDGRLGILTSLAMATKVPAENLLTIGKHLEKLGHLAGKNLNVKLLDEIKSGELWDIVIDCSGKTSGFETAVKLLKPRGQLILKSTFVPDKAIDLSTVVINELEIIGSRCGHFEDAIEALSSGSVDTSGLITSRYDFNDAVTAFATAADGKNIKVILDF